jgi:hypothetical protein
MYYLYFEIWLFPGMYQFCLLLGVANSMFVIITVSPWICYVQLCEKENERNVVHWSTKFNSLKDQLNSFKSHGSQHDI